MKFGVMLPVSGPFASAQAIRQVALEGEALGYHGVGLHDHMNWGAGDEYHFMGGSAEAVDLAKEKGQRVDHFYEGLVTLAYVAGITRSLKLIPAAAVLPWRHPVALGKQLSTLQDLSQGRVLAGVCIGNVRGDFEALGVPFPRRGAIMEEYLQVLRDVLSPQQEVVSFAGRWVQVPHGVFFPKAKIPLLYAGESDRALERVARYCDGWLPLGSPEFIQERLPVLEGYLRAQGRDMKEMTIGFSTKVCIASSDREAQEKARYTMEKRVGLEEIRRHPTLAGAFIVGSSSTIAGYLKRYVKAGTEWALVSFISHDLEQTHQDMVRFAREVMPQIG